tara:strand:+ start:97 stop:840 length:744 start_codon:yes stop_codon:yes gene_type:complete
MHGHQIGDCTLLHANSLDALPTIGAVDHIVTDPPYEAIMHRAKTGAARRIRIDGRTDIKSLDFDCINDIRDDVAGLIADVCDGWSLIFCTPEGVGRWADAINATTAKYKRACIWVKPDSTPQLNGQGPGMGYENVIASWCGSGYSRWNAGGKRGVYTHLTNPKDRHGVHPTEKPLRLMKELLADFTNEGDLVCDPFMGSGTTGVACAQMGRKFVGVELNRNYFDIAVKRIGDAYKQPDFFVPQPVAI